MTLTDKDSPICPVGHILCDDCYASADSTRWNTRATAAKDAEIEALRAECASAEENEAIEYKLRGEAEARAERLAEALRFAEAALADIGDADREPGDDVEWCERRAAQALPTVRAALNTTAAQENDDA